MSNDQEHDMPLDFSALELDDKTTETITYEGIDTDMYSASGGDESVGAGDDASQGSGQGSSRGSCSMYLEEDTDSYDPDAVEHLVSKLFTQLVVQHHHQHIVNPFPFTLPLARPYTEYFDNDSTDDDDNEVLRKPRLELLRWGGGSYNDNTKLSLSLPVFMVPHAHPLPHPHRANSYESESGIGSSFSSRPYEYMWRTPKSCKRDVTRAALLLNHLYHQTSLPVPKLLALSADNKNIDNRYILTEVAPGECLGIVLRQDPDLEQRSEAAEMMARLIAQVVAIKIEGADGLFGEICVEDHHAKGKGTGQDRNLDHEAVAVGFTSSDSDSDGDSDKTRLVVRSFRFNARDARDREVRDPSTHPNSSDQDLATTSTLRSYILTRLQQRLASAVADNRKNGSAMYRRLLVVAERLLDPERTPEVDVMRRSVLVHTGLHPENIFVSVKRRRIGQETSCPSSTCLGCGGRPSQYSIIDRDPARILTPWSSSSTGKLTVTSVLDWDDPQAWHPLMAYSLLYPYWLWDPIRQYRTTWTKHYTLIRDDKRHDSVRERMNMDDKLVKERFEREIETRIPGFMAMVHSADDIGLIRLIRYANKRIFEWSWSDEARIGVQVLERLADERDGLRRAS